MADEFRIQHEDLVGLVSQTLAGEGMRAQAMDTWLKHAARVATHSTSKESGGLSGSTAPVGQAVTQALQAFTFYFDRNDAGLFRVHAYRYDDTSSTFIVECTAETFARLGAAPLAPGSKDAALLATLPPAAYTAHLTAQGGTGVAPLQVGQPASVWPSRRGIFRSRSSPASRSPRSSRATASSSSPPARPRSSARS